MHTRALFLVFLIALSFSAYTHDRPWNEPYYSEYCPYVISIPYFPEIWDVKAMTPPLDSLNLSRVAYGPEVSKEIESARKSYGNAKEVYTWSITCSLSCFPGLPSNIVFILEKVVFERSAPTQSDFRELLNYGIDLILQAISPYLAYPSYWKGTANSALDALDKSFQINDMEWGRVYSLYREMDYMGLCNADYLGPASAECKYSRQMLSALGHTDAGRAGSYSRAFSHLNKLTQSFYSQKPDFSSYSLAMEELWGPNGSIIYAREIQSQSSSAIESAKDSLKSEEFSAESLSSQAKSSLKKLKDEKVGLIASPREVSTVQQQSFLASMQSFEDAIQAGDSHMSYAKKLQSEKPRGWLAESMQNLQEAKLLYSRVASESPALLADARSAVSSKRQDAMSATAELYNMQLSLRQKERLEALNSSLLSSESLPLGDQYLLYENIIKECKTINEEAKSGSIAVLSYKLSSLRELMEKAKKDGIPIQEEEQRLALLEEMGPTEDGIQSIQDSIILKASIKYAEVPFLREQVLSYLSTGAFPDLQAKVRQKERGLVYDSFSFELALGSLHALEAFYIETLEEIEGRKGEIALSSLILEHSSRPIVATLDSPSLVSAYIVATNPTDYYASGASASIPFPLQVISSDLQNVKTFSYKSGTLNLYFDVAPHESKTIKVSKEAVLASTIKIETMAEGKYGNAYVDEERSIFLEIDCDALEIPLTDEGTIDGVPFYNSIMAKPIKQGKHTLSFSYVVPNAYNVEYTSVSATPVSGGTYFSYTITLTPHMDLDVAYLPIEYGANAEPISYHEIETAASYVVIAKVHNGEQAKVRIFWTAENISSEIDSLESQLSLLNLTESEQFQFDQIELMADSAEKAKLLLSLKKAVDKRLLEEAKKAAQLEQEQEALSSLISRYSSALSLANSLGEKTLSPTISADLSALIEANRTGAKVDFSIEKRRIKEFKEALYNYYYSLKEKSYGCNSSLSSADSLFSSLELSPSLETAVRISSILEATERELSSCQPLPQPETPAASLLKEVESLISRYNNEFADAKELGLTSLLPYTTQGVESSYQKAKKAGEAELQRFKELLSSVMERLEEKAESSASSLEKLGIDSSRVRDHIKEGRYIKAIAAAQSLLSSRGKDNNLLIIGAVALVVLGAVAFLYMKGSKEKELRRLKKI
ncbi:MAG: hypothetical protein QW035_01980 [Candidatus Anstonellales archaeon]